MLGDPRTVQSMMNDSGGLKGRIYISELVSSSQPFTCTTGFKCFVDVIYYFIYLLYFPTQSMP